MYLKYRGKFQSRDGAIYTINIYQLADSAFTVGELTFEADEPLIIEWQRTDKEAVICSSTATLRIESPGDRTYQDMYAIEVGSIRLDVLRNGALYWSGTLDTEFYEEPYERAANYPVSLTFSDFGIWNRLKYNMDGMQTILSVLEDAISRSNASLTLSESTYTPYCSTTFEDGSACTVQDLMVRADNFYDEESEPMTLYDVIEGVLQPLALKIIQRSGKVWVYDLNGLYHSAPNHEICWDGDASTMSVDKVANNVKISFSPYSAPELLTDSAAQFTGEYSRGTVSTGGTDVCDSFYADLGEPRFIGGNTITSIRPEHGSVNFTIFHGAEGQGVSICPEAQFFHLQPMVGSGAQECDGVMWGYVRGHQTLDTSSALTKLIGKRCCPPDTAQIVPLLRSTRVFIPNFGNAADDAENNTEGGQRPGANIVAGSYYLRLVLEAMIDARYNPFSSAEKNEDKDKDNNENVNHNLLQENTAWAFIPVSITIYDSNGADRTALYHYCNSNIATSGTIGSLAYAQGSWKPGAASFGDAWVEYYDTEDQKKKSGLSGWSKNRHCIGRPDTLDRLGGRPQMWAYIKAPLSRVFKEMPAGEYIPYPPVGGFLEVCVYAGIHCYGWGETSAWGVHKKWDALNLYDKVRWILYKTPAVEIVGNDLKFDLAELDDVEYSGYINKAAKDDISIDTICGSTEIICPSARGIYYKASDKSQVNKLVRAGFTDHPEKLLIGTLYSQFAARKITLKGEVRINPDGLNIYTEQNQGTRVFMISGEVQDLIAGTSDATYTELSPDEYEAIEEVI